MEDDIGLKHLIAVSNNLTIGMNSVTLSSAFADSCQYL